MEDKATGTTELNLARKWRSRQFDQIVGQDLSIRMLKNSIYLDHFFPVYLFSGQRGCGKTTTARVFACAVNCEQFSQFKKNPSIPLPCLTCISCKAMAEGKHPDFIEIDAASHTGVDNVRSIIDSASLLPLLGSKKIYLVDEAHMLSKAAFNALLKILEEPPTSTLFILATTDSQKIIETVKSRCFQLYFNAIDNSLLKNHLVEICKAEKIPYEEQAIDIIVDESGGSARDALNLVEQVRFAASIISKESVAQVLGHFSEAEMILLFSSIMQNDPVALLGSLASSSFYQSNILFIWKKCIQLLRQGIWSKYGVKPQEKISEVVDRIVKGVSVGTLQKMMQIFYENEPILIKVINQHSFVEMVLLQLCSLHAKKSGSSGDGGTNTPAALGTSVEKEESRQEEEIDEYDDDAEEEEDEEVGGWNRFLHAVTQCGEPILNSLFSQAVVTSCSKEKNCLEIEMAKESYLFSDWLEKNEQIWKPLLKKAFWPTIELKIVFRQSSSKGNPATRAASEIRSTENPIKTNYTKNQSPSRPDISKSSIKRTSQSIDISDASRWKTAHIIMRYFPGTIVELTE